MTIIQKLNALPPKLQKEVENYIDYMIYQFKKDGENYRSLKDSIKSSFEEMEDIKAGKVEKVSLQSFLDECRDNSIQ